MTFPSGEEPGSHYSNEDNEISKHCYPFKLVSNFDKELKTQPMTFSSFSKVIYKKTILLTW